jgi:uncharacterized protein
LATDLFRQKPVIGMIHVGALPGTPAACLTVGELMEVAVSEARIYRDAGIDGIIVENMHDVPYLRKVGPEIVSSMAVICKAVKDESRLPLGVQILAGANLEAMAVALAAGLEFVRVEGYIYAHIADEGWIESSAAELLRYRKSIGADKIQVWADIKKKHSSHTITTDITLGESARTVAFMRGDASIVTGSSTGEPPQIKDILEAKAHSGLPVILGSGVTAENVSDFYEHADGFIVGSYFKRDGLWSNPVDTKRVEFFLNSLNELRQLK